MKLRMILLALVVTTTFAVGRAHATTVFMPETVVVDVRTAPSIVARAPSPKPLAMPDAPVSGVATWAVMAVVLGLTGARRVRKVRLSHHV
jgi:hypothetical protein